MSGPGALRARVEEAVAAVADPEYPGVTISDLGILEAVTVDETSGGATVMLVPTMLGCPALGAIEADVTRAARGAGATDVEVRFLATPVWTPERIRPEARTYLARELAVAVASPGAGPGGGPGGGVTCPVCGSAEVRHRSDVGSTRCREVWWCDDCRNPVEVVRR